MPVHPIQAPAGSIILGEEVPSLAPGRLIVATVLSSPKDGMVLVSMFGRRIFVETDIPLSPGQVLNLKVHSVSPKVVMKPVQENVPEGMLKPLDRLVEELVGSFGRNSVASFDVREIVKRILDRQGDDPDTARSLLSLLQEFSRLSPAAVAYLVVPFVQEEHRGSARVTVEREGDEYRLSFTMETDALGLIESTVLRASSGMYVEICSAFGDVVSFLRGGLEELAHALQPFGVRSIEVVQRSPLPKQPAVDMLV